MMVGMGKDAVLRPRPPAGRSRKTLERRGCPDIRAITPD
jgi:hypothetical protein